MAAFVDRVVLSVTAGSGGHGVASVRREKFKPLGGPDGGNGGNGGDVILEVDASTTTLLDYHHTPHRKAENGGQGAGDLRQGKNGGDLVLPVPEGTVVKDRAGNLLADMVGIGTRYVAAAGGRGGLGNAALASKRRKAPGFALLGEPGEEVDLVLELKSMADVALVGFPSAGKSSLVAAMSAARPKIADYPFTTLQPHLGVVTAGDARYTIADVPGLIPGAADGKGLGLDFLRHIERCSVILHVLDCATLEPDRDPMNDLDTLERELAQYAADLDIAGGRVPLMERPRVVVLNKIDVPDARELADMVAPDLRARGLDVVEISTATHEGLKELSFLLARLVAEVRASEPAPEAQRIILRPQAKDDGGITVTRRTGSEGEFFQVRGARPERWVTQTDFANDEAVGYLADRLNRAGVEDQLLKAGAVAGSMVVIGEEVGGVVFDWEPTMATGAELLGPRGTDARLDDVDRAYRPSRAEKRRDYEEWMDAKAEARRELWSEREAGQWTSPDED